MNRLPAHRVGLGIAGLLAAAVALTLLGVPLASAQGTTVFVRDARTAIPVDDPWSSAWEEIVPVPVALGGQGGVIPTLPDPSISGLQVRALRDDQQVSILLEWADPTKDEAILRSDRFADQVAIQFATGEGISICMGQQAGSVDVWLWKADWAAELAGRRGLADAYPNAPLDEVHPLVPAADASPAPGPVGFMTARDAGNPRAAAALTSSVEDLNAVGFGSLTPQPAARQNVRGTSDHRDGRWRVIFTRPLASDDPSDAIIDPRALTVAALAVWDGSNGDRDGRKAVSAWLALAFEPRPAGPFDAGTWPFLLVLLLALGLSAVVVVIGARQPAAGLGWPAAVVPANAGPGDSQLPRNAAADAGTLPAPGGDESTSEP
jgi:hypothetical protein